MKTDSLFLCLNAFDGKAPNRIQLIPSGPVIKGVDGREWTLRDPANFCAHANKSDSVTVKSGCAIDINHSTDLSAVKGGESPAVGWFKNFAVDRDGSIWADVEWNARGKSAIENREYRFISPVFTQKDGEIKEILRAALTNNPNLDNPALNANALTGADGNTKDAGKLAEEKVMKKELCVALGIPEGSSEDDALKAVIKMKELNASSAKVDLASYAPRADLNAALERAAKAEKTLLELNAASLKAKAGAAVEKAVADGRIAPASKDAYIELCATEEGFAKFEKIMAVTPSMTGEVTPSKVPPSSSGQKTELNAAEREMMTSMGYTEEEYKKIKAMA